MITPVLICNSPVETFAPTRKVSLDEMAYHLQCSLVEDAWHRHNAAIDSWIAVGNYEAIHESREACEQMEEKCHQLYKQAFCEHKGLMDGESTCPDCGKTFDQSFI